MTLDSILSPLFFILIFPGFLFLSLYGFFLKWLDKKICALIKNTPNPATYRPITDFIKHLSKESRIPKRGNPTLLKFLPFFAIAAITTSVLMIPIWEKALFSFQGDLIVVLYLLTIPAMTFFIANNTSNRPFVAIEELRTITQLFVYEAPFILAFLGPAIIAGSWNIREISKFMFQSPLLLIVQILGLIIALIAFQGKLKRLPLDKIEARDGAFTEYSGGLLAFSNLAINMEMVVGAALINVVFLGGAFNLVGIFAVGVFILKTIFILLLLSLLKIFMTRMRINQMIHLCWKILIPLSLAQIALNVFIKIKMQ